jgi:hypothetical protein
MNEKTMNEKLMTNARLWLVLGALACASSAAAFNGTYTYKLILRDDNGFPLGGADNASVSQNYTVEVFDSNGEKVAATAADASIGGNTGHNCSLSVSVGEGTGYAAVGERLTLVVMEKSGGNERFRSSKVLPPVGGMFGIANAPVGAFWADSADADNGWDVWRREIERSLLGSISIGGPDEDYDGDGFTNLSEYRFGTDPTGKIPAEYGFAGKPEVSIVEQDGVLKVNFNYGWGGHVYSVRSIEGVEPVGRDGNDLPLYESAASLESGDSCGTYFYDAANSGTKTFFVKKPELDGAYLVGLAVDGQLLEYIKVGELPPESVTVSPGYPIEYASEAEAMSAKAIATVAPTEAVGAVLTGEGMTNVYNAAFTAEVIEKDGKWLLSAELTPQAWTNLMENATAATRQLPVGEIALLESGATMNVVLSSCTPGFYYSLSRGAELKGIAPDAEAENLGVLCGADGIVEFPKAAKPGDEAGFYKVVISVASGE